MTARIKLSDGSVRRLVYGIVDGSEGNEGVGSTAGRKRTRADEWLQVMYVVERCFVLC